MSREENTCSLNGFSAASIDELHHDERSAVELRRSALGDAFPYASQYMAALLLHAYIEVVPGPPGHAAAPHATPHKQAGRAGAGRAGSASSRQLAATRKLNVQSDSAGGPAGRAAGPALAAQLPALEVVPVSACWVGAKSETWAGSSPLTPAPLRKKTHAYVDVASSVT